MNAPLRRLGVVVAALFVVLLGAATWTQYLDGAHLRADGRNSRAIYAALGRPRGAILVGDTAVASSTKVDDAYSYQRGYADGPLYAAVTGAFPVTGAPTGLEYTEDSLLAGTSDRLFYRRLRDVLSGHSPAGAIVETTIDAKAQAAAAAGLGSQRGAAVALDPRTGAVLALYSSPSYDPNALASHDAAAVVTRDRALRTADGSPLLDRALNQTYPPGSMFKLVDAAAALESGTWTASSTLAGPGTLDLPGSTATLSNDDRRACGTDGRVSLTDALRVSCNTAFANLGMSLGQTALAAQAAKFGFGTTMDVPLHVDASRFPTGLSQASLAQASIGQLDDTVTPLQAAMLSAAIANDGVLMKPNLIKTVRGSDLEVVDAPRPVELDRAVSAQTAKTLTTMMEAVVTSGTGTPAQIPGIAVAGKTGTAQNKPGAAPHAWFTAFAPANDPKIAVAVVVEHGGRAGSEASGGTVAAPIAKRIIQAYLADTAASGTSTSGASR